MKFVFVFIGVLCFVGCSAPTQRVAENAMTVGLSQQRSIVHDLVNMAKQNAVNDATSTAIEAVRNGDESAVRDSVEGLANQFQKIGWLEIQHERSIAILRLAQQYIWQQQGVLDIYSREFQSAKNAINGIDLDNN